MDDDSVTRVVRTKHVEEDTLCSKNQSPEENTWLLDRHERHEVHALVFGFLKKRVDPAAIPPLQYPQCLYLSS